MKVIYLPKNFNGKLFQEKYNLDTNDFYAREKVLFYDDTKTGKELDDNDLLDCITDTAKVERIRNRFDNSFAHAKDVPGWSTWDRQQALDWINAHISDTQIDSAASLEDFRVILKDFATIIRGIVLIEIALRDNIWPNLPEE